jgi:hypothetical protein
MLEEIKGALILDMLMTDTSNNQLKNSLELDFVSLEESEIILHLVASRVKKNSKNSGRCEFDSVVFSLTSKSSEFFDIGGLAGQVSCDLSDNIHTRVYCKEICNTTDDKLWLNRNMTKYCRSLSYFDYMYVLERLLHEHAHRTIKMKNNPRKSREQNFTEDQINRALAVFLKRIMAIINFSLYWGKVDSVPFSINNAIEMRTALR